MATKKTMNFEVAMERLEEIVRTLEDGSEGLDVSLELYQEGIGLVCSCTEKLEHAEQTVKMLQTNPDGTASFVDFEEG